MHISNVDVWSLMTKPVGLYAGPSLKFCLPVFTNFSSCSVSFITFVVCVCLYSSTMKASSDCKMSETYLRGTDQRSCVVNIYLGAFAKFIHFCIWICHISPPKTKLQLADQLERKGYIFWAREKMICVDIGDKSATQQTDSWRKGTKDKETTLS